MSLFLWFNHSLCTKAEICQFFSLVKRFMLKSSDLYVLSKKIQYAHFFFNPKRHRLFVQLNIWGWGVDSIHFGKTKCKPPNFISEQQTESHMKAEVFSFNLIPYWVCWGWNCGLTRPPNRPGSRQKKINQKFWNLQFLSYTNIIHLKRKLKKIVH